ncbi:MAG: tRNA pseudouridine(55) synthase TruB [Thermoanaerobaculia bacterium]
MGFDGLLYVDKEGACTSHDVVQRVRRIFGQKRVGHCGTLDPDATGLLLVTLGAATRLTRFLIQARKVYEGTVRFGVATDTYDSSGRVVSEQPTAGLDEPRIDEAMASFVGTFEQRLPAYSARKVQGVKLYEMARRGEEVPELNKEVTVDEFRRLDALADDRIRFRLTCSSGTYARSLAHDLGQRLGCGAHLAGLRRTRIGKPGLWFDLEQALPLGELERRRREGIPLGGSFQALREIPLPFPTGTLDAQQERRTHHGQTVFLPGLGAETGDWVRLVDRTGELIAVGSVTERIGSAGTAIVQPRIVFQQERDLVEFPRT